MISGRPPVLTLNLFGTEARNATPRLSPLLGTTFRQTFRRVRQLACRAAAIAFLPMHCLVSAILDRLLRRGVLRQESDQVELDFRRVLAMIASDPPRQKRTRSF